MPDDGAAGRRPEHEVLAGERRREDWAAAAMRELASPPRDRGPLPDADPGTEAKAKVWVLCELRRVVQHGGIAAAANSGLVAPPEALPLCADSGAGTSPPASPQRYRATLSRAVDDDCEGVLSLIDRRVLPSATAPAARCFFRLMAAAHAAALRQCTEGARRREAAARAATQYAVAAEEAAAGLPPRDPLRLLCALRRAEYLTALGRDRDGGGDPFTGLLCAWGWHRHAAGLACGIIDSLHTMAEGTHDDWRRCGVPEADARALAFAARGALRREVVRRTHSSPAVARAAINIYATNEPGDPLPPPLERPEEGRPGPMPDTEWVCELEDGWRAAVHRVASTALREAEEAAAAEDAGGVSGEGGDDGEEAAALLIASLRRCLRCAEPPAAA